MSQNRKFPFGYCMEDGQIRIVTSEQELIVLLFTRYLAGDSIPQLTILAQESGIAFHSDDTRWNKNMVCRILDNEAYGGQGRFPAMIDPVMLESVRRKRKAQSSGKLNPAVKVVRNHVRCESCGGGMIRICRGKQKVHWQCKKCAACTAPLTDADLLNKITLHLNCLIRCPDKVVPIPTASTTSLLACALRKEFDRKLTDANITDEQLITLAKKCAELNYSICEASYQGQTQVILQKLSESHASETLNTELFDAIVQHVLIRVDGEVYLLLKNQQKIS